MRAGTGRSGNSEPDKTGTGPVRNLADTLRITAQGQQRGYEKRKIWRVSNGVAALVDMKLGWTGRWVDRALALARPLLEGPDGDHTIKAGLAGTIAAA